MDRGEGSVGPTDDEASTEWVSYGCIICVALCHVRFVPRGLQNNEHSFFPPHIQS